jgi:hypothetical protein
VIHKLQTPMTIPPAPAATSPAPALVPQPVAAPSSVPPTPAVHKPEAATVAPLLAPRPIMPPPVTAPAQPHSTGTANDPAIAPKSAET